MEHLTEDLIDEYALRRCGPALTELIECHLAVCEVCREQVAAVRALIDELRRDRTQLMECVLAYEQSA